MATLRKRNGRIQVQVRRRGHPAQSKTFLDIKDARVWARQMEAEADRGTLPDCKVLKRVTLGELVTRYRDTVSIRKRSANIEHIVLTAFLKHSICDKRLSEVTGAAFVQYRDERLLSVKPATVKRQLAINRRETHCHLALEKIAPLPSCHEFPELSSYLPAVRARNSSRLQGLLR
jgi:hypothetical protein